jgi:nicotinamidase-related amidase
MQPTVVSTQSGRIPDALREGVDMKPALFVVDIQERFLTLGERTAESFRKAIGLINPAIALFRERKLPIICIQHVAEEENLIPGGQGFGSPAELQILPSDKHIHKTYGNAFTKTALADELRRLNVDTVIITGFSAEHCALSTYLGAENIDLTPIILRGSLVSVVPERVQFVEDISNLISFEALRKVLEGCG